MNTILKELRKFYPDAKAQDRELIDAGIRPQAIKTEYGDAGILYFGTEFVSTGDITIFALLGASWENFVCVSILLEGIQNLLLGLCKRNDAQADM